jgi:hypothetical protein
MATNAGSPDGGAPKSDDEGKGKTNEDTVKRSELEEAVRRRQEALEDKRKADERIKELEAALSGKADDEAAKAGDIEKLRQSALDRENLLKKQLDDANKAHAESVLRSDVVSVLAEVSTDPEVAFLILKDEFEVKPDDTGMLRARPKGDVSSAKDFILKKLDAKPYLLKNGRQPGTGTKPTSEEGKPSMTLAQIQKLSDGEQRAAFAANPDLAKQVLGMK